MRQPVSRANRITARISTGSSKSSARNRRLEERDQLDTFRHEPHVPPMMVRWSRVIKPLTAVVLIGSFALWHPAMLACMDGMQRMDGHVGDGSRHPTAWRTAACSPARLLRSLRLHDRAEPPHPSDPGITRRACSCPPRPGLGSLHPRSHSSAFPSVLDRSSTPDRVVRSVVRRFLSGIGSVVSR